MRIKSNWKEILYKKAFDEKVDKLSIDEIIKFFTSISERDYVDGSVRRKELITLLKGKGVYPLVYRQLAREIGVTHPQTIKHHLEVLEKEKVIHIDREDMLITFIDTK